MDDFVYDFERQPSEEIKEYEPLRDAMIMAVPQARALRGGVPLRRNQSGAYSAQVVEAQDEEDEGEQVLQGKEASDDELEAEVTRKEWAMMTVA